MRICTKCHREFPHTGEFFYKSKRSVTGLREQCKECVREYNGSGGWENHIRRKYGMTATTYQEMLDAQGGVCFICGHADDKKLHVDHCHETGKIRKLLCTNCNRAIGHAQESPKVLRRMADYIEDESVIAQGKKRHLSATY